MTQRGPLDVVESRVRNLLIDQADLRERAERTRRKEEDARKALLLAVVGVKDAAEAFLADAQAKAPDAAPTAHLGDVVRLMARLLAANQVEEASALGREPDARWHRIVETVVDEATPDGRVTREFVKAYLWMGELLRGGQVAVARRGE